MLQEDSNGEASFEIIDKKNEESSASGDKTESLSSVSSAYSIPSPSLVNIPGGNLLSNLPPPSNLPDFALWQSQPNPVAAPTPLPQNILPPGAPGTLHDNSGVTVIAQSSTQPFLATQFSAAIPPSKGIQHGPPTHVTDSGHNAGGLIGWMKDAVSTGGILQKVAEKAKNSIDSVITTLDPQMTEFIYSGGDVEIAVASQDSEEVAPIRDAIYSVFGKAWVNGVDVNIDHKAVAIGFEEGVKRAEATIEASLLLKKSPIIAIENILLHQNDNYFDLSILMLKDNERQITLHTYTQTTPLPTDEFMKEAETAGYARSCDSPEQLLATYLKNCKMDWQHSTSGVSKRETLLLAAKVLIGVYKNKLVVNQ